MFGCHSEEFYFLKRLCETKQEWIASDTEYGTAGQYVIYTHKSGLRVMVWHDRSAFMMPHANDAPITDSEQSQLGKILHDQFSSERKMKKLENEQRNESEYKRWKKSLNKQIDKRCGMKVKVKILEDTDLENMEHNINELIANGWELHGVIVVSHDTKWNPAAETYRQVPYYIQTMIKK